MEVTYYDVACEANVLKGKVLRVVNGKPNVKP